MSGIKTLAGVSTGFISLSIPMPSSSGMDEALKIVVATIMTFGSQVLMAVLKEWQERRKERKAALKAALKIKHDENASA